ncbi:MAG TPA: hypothetical protein VG389_11230 [Myxococcota bacterium]|jgi:catechol 1,2-dioxygenase|nr:hypothetical protein [Myxococcota bacterium]
MKDLSRREFLQRGGGGLVAASAGLAGLGAFTHGLHTRSAAAAAATEPGCAVTEDNIEGPFYRPDAPWKEYLIEPGMKGPLLWLTGRVFGPDCKRPLAGAVLDFWQADAGGHYDNDDPAHPPAADHFVLRGRQRTNAEGRWSLQTVVPGRYRIGPKTWRPAHVHVKVHGPGTALLTTQLYFAGDPYLAGDPWMHPSLVLSLFTTDFYPGQRGTFDFVLMEAGAVR